MQILARLFVLCALSQYAAAAVDVTQSRYDLARTGSNSQETLLHTGNVNVHEFGLLQTYPVDGDIYAQPLYMSNIKIPGKGIRNVLYVATMHDVIYAFDADATGDDKLLWMKDLKNPALGIGPVPVTLQATNRNIRRYMGIESTPVIDRDTQTLYLVARTLEQNSYVQRLHALDLATGAEKHGSPVVIAAEYKSHTFNPRFQHQRAGLTLVSGQVVICWAADALEITMPYYGWIMSYDAQTLKQTGVWTTTTTVYGGGIWASGRAPAVIDNATGTQDLILFTGNAIKTSDGFDGVGNFAESMLRLRVDPHNPENALSLVDWFTPDNWKKLDKLDLDLGGSGPVILPGSGYIVGGGKEGIMYVVDPNNMGKLQTGNPALIQSFRAVPSLHIMGGGVVWDGTPSGHPLKLYNWGESDKLKAFTFSKGKFDLNLTQSSKEYIGGHPGGILTLSSNGSKPGTGIVWASGSNKDNAISSVKQGILRAYNAEDITQLLWSSRMNPGDDALAFAKFTPPTVANGKVYLATFSNKVLAYGLLPKKRPRQVFVALQSRLGNKQLEVDKATRFPGSHLGMGDPSDWARQRWELGILPNGDRVFKSAISNLLIDDGLSARENQATTRLWPKRRGLESVAQSWQILPSVSGYVHVVSRSTGRALTVVENGNTHGAIVETRTQDGKPGQDWKIVKQSDAGVTECNTSRLQLVSALPGNPLLSAAPDGAVRLEKPAHSTAQHWELVTSADGNYALHALEKDEWLTTLAETVLTHPQSGDTPDSSWTLHHIEDAAETFSTITSILNGNALTAKNAATVVTAKPMDSNRQKWRIQDEDSIWCLE